MAGVFWRKKADFADDGPPGRELDDQHHLAGI
jgi:hypothetical protein